MEGYASKKKKVAYERNKTKQNKHTQQQNKTTETMATSKSNMFSSLSNSGNLAYEILDAAYMGILYFVVVSVVSRLIVMVDNALFPRQRTCG